MNKRMVEGENIIIYGELLIWISIWFIITTIQGFQRRGSLRNSAIYPFKMAPYRFNSIVPRTRFEEILKKLTLTEYPQPEYKDTLWESSQMLYVWNFNIDFFHPAIFLVWMSQ